MGSSLHLSETAVNGIANYLSRRINGGKLRIYNGDQPINADRKITSQILLVEFSPLPDPAFAEATDGKLVSREIEPTRAIETGKAMWYRILTANNTPLWDGSVGESDCDMNISDTNIFAGAEVSLEAWEHLVPK